MVGGTLGGALLGLIGTLITQYVTGRREDKRHQHEMEIKRMELEDSRLERRRDERLETYRKFYAAMHSMTLFLGERPATEASPEFQAQLIHDFWTARTGLELIASPAVRIAAEDLHDSLVFHPELR